MSASSTDYDALQKLTMMAMSMHGVHILYSPADQRRAWNADFSVLQGFFYLGAPLIPHHLGASPTHPTNMISTMVPFHLQTWASIKVVPSLEILDRRLLCTLGW